MIFKDRFHAGRVLAARLLPYQGRQDVRVLALPRGGVPVGYEVARILQAPLDVLVVRKIGLPQCPELAIGAIASGGIEEVPAPIAAAHGVSRDRLQDIIEAEREELAHREALYRDGLPFPEVRGKTVLLIDDGLATGLTMRAALQAVRMRNPAHIVVAVPVGSQEACRELEKEGGNVVCAHVPEDLGAVGNFYADFSQSTDKEVNDLLCRARGWHFCPSA
jgi:predicted phosphoribosyltransferase